MSAVSNLWFKARQAAHRLTQHGHHGEAIVLAECVGRAIEEVNARCERRKQLAAYHTKRASECEGPTRRFHIEAAQFLLEWIREEDA